MGYIEADAQAWIKVTDALRDYLLVQAEHTYVRDWDLVVRQIIAAAHDAMIDALDGELLDRFTLEHDVMIDDLLPEVMQDARGMRYTGDNQPKGA
jgi:hypothetical protein